MEKELIKFHHFSALLLSCCHKKQEHLFAPLRLCVSASLRETFWLRPSALVTLVTRNFSHSKKGVIPSFPPCLPCHPGKHQRAGHSSNLPPPPAVFPTADSSPRFARFGMTRERSFHPEERQPPVSSRGASATRDLQWKTQAGGRPKPEKTLQGIIAKL
jgi:hypothetical protein